MSSIITKHSVRYFKIDGGTWLTGELLAAVTLLLKYIYNNFFLFGCATSTVQQLLDSAAIVSVTHTVYFNTNPRIPSKREGGVIVTVIPRDP